MVSQAPGRTGVVISSVKTPELRPPSRPSRASFSQRLRNRVGSPGPCPPRRLWVWHAAPQVLGPRLGGKLKASPRGRDNPPFSRSDGRTEGSSEPRPLLAGVVPVLPSASKRSDPGRGRRRTLPGLAAPAAGAETLVWAGPQARTPGLVPFRPGLHGNGWSLRLRGDRQGPGFSRRAPGQQVSSSPGTCGEFESHRGDKSSGFHRHSPQLSALQ